MNDLLVPPLHNPLIVDNSDAFFESLLEIKKALSESIDIVLISFNNYFDTLLKVIDITSPDQFMKFLETSGFTIDFSKSKLVGSIMFERVAINFDLPIDDNIVSKFVDISKDAPFERFPFYMLFNAVDYDEALGILDEDKQLPSVRADYSKVFFDLTNIINGLCNRSIKNSTCFPSISRDFISLYGFDIGKYGGVVFDLKKNGLVSDSLGANLEIAFYDVIGEVKHNYGFYLLDVLNESPQKYELQRDNSRI